MKVSKEVSAQHKEQIIAAAARHYRERGFEGITVAELMKDVGLTHGGFYRHFSSKEELIAAALLRAASESIHEWRKIAEDARGTDCRRSSSPICLCAITIIRKQDVYWLHWEGISPVNPLQSRTQRRRESAR